MNDGIHDRIVIAYSVAMQAVHTGGRVEIHLGSEVIEYLRSLNPKNGPETIGATCWGFPVISNGSPDHISIHTVQTIL